MKKINLPFIVFLFIFQIIFVLSYKFFFFKYPELKEKEISGAFKVIRKKGKNVFLKDLKTKEKFLLTTEKLNQGDVVFLKGRIKNFKRSRNPYEFDEAKYYSLKGLKAKIENFKIKEIKHRKGIFLIKDFIKKILKEKLTRSNFLILNAIMWGESKKLPYNIRRLFYITGTPHLMAVSGLHMGMVAFVIHTILSIFLKRNISLILTPFFLLTYSYLSNLSPSSLRSAIMFSIIMLSFVTGRKTSPLILLISSAVILTFLKPFIIFDLSFQLSYFAVFFIIYLTPVFDKILKKFFPEIISLPFSVSLSAQLGIFALLINYFHHISVISVIVNIFAVPITGLIYTGTILGILTHPLTFITNLFFESVNLLLSILVFILRKFAIDRFYIFVPSLGFFLILSYYLFLLGLKNFKIFSLSIIFFILSFIPRFFINKNYLFFPYSKGYSVLLKKDNKNFVFGAGNKKVFDFLKFQGEREIEKIFIFSPSYNSLSFFEDFIKNFEIKEVCFLKGLKKTNILENAIYLAERGKIKRIFTERFNLDEIKIYPSGEKIVLKYKNKKFPIYPASDFGIIKKYKKAVKFDFDKNKWYFWEGKWKYIKLAEKQ